MNKQKIATTAIGVVLAALLIFIGIRIVQQRGSRASAPDSIMCERISENTIRVISQTATEVPLLYRYGTSAETPTFFRRVEEREVTPNSDGRFTQTTDITGVSSDAITVLVEGAEDSRATCDPFTVSTEDTSAEEGIIPTSDPIITEPPEELPTVSVTEEPTPTQTVERTALNLDDAKECFTDGTCETIQDCVAEFEDEHTGLANVCQNAYNQTQ